jgi:RecA/RadA recombinase
LRNSTRFIEFYGLPGIGKTTVVKELQSNSKLNGKKNIIFIIGTNSFNISSFIRKCYFVTTLLIKRKGNLKILIEIYNSGQDSVLTFLKLAFNFLWIESLYMYYKDKNKIVVLDQGLIQAYWSLLYSSKKEIKLKYKNYS